MNINTASAIALHFMAKQHNMTVEAFSEQIGIPPIVSTAIKTESTDSLTIDDIQDLYEGLGDHKLVMEFIELIESIQLLSSYLAEPEVDSSSLVDKLAVVTAINEAIKEVPNGLQYPDFPALTNVIESLFPDE